jgi:hypothetical protein
MRSRALLALAVVLAACGGEADDDGDGVASLDQSSSTTIAEAEEANPEAAAIAFTECMRENGIEMEDPTVDADGNVTPGLPTDLPEPDDNGQVRAGSGELGQDLRAAFEECGDLLDGTAFGLTPQDLTELEDQLLELAECLRGQGLDVADPDLSGQGGGPEGGGPFGIDFQDPEVQAAMDQCEEFVPGIADGEGGGPRIGFGAPGDGDDQ